MRSGGYVPLSIAGADVSCTGRIVANVADASLARRSLTVTGPDYPIDTWFHVAVTWDGSTLRIYLDGAEVARAVQRPDSRG